MSFQNNFQHQFTGLTVGDQLVSVSGAGVEIVQGADYFSMTDQSVRLTQSGVDFIQQNGLLPTLAVRETGGETTYLITRSFGMTDDVNIKPAVDPAVKDFKTLQVRNIDATAANHSIAMLKTELSGVAEFEADLVSASLNLWTTTGNRAATDGGLDLYLLADTSWSEATISASPYAATSPTDGITIDAAFADTFGSHAPFATGAGFDVADSAVHFDLTTSGLGNGDVSFALLSDGVSTDNYWLHSSESDAVALRPTVTVSYATTTPVRAVDDTLTVAEGGSNIGTPLKLLDNDIALATDAARVITSINGTAWDDLPMSDHAIFSEAGAFRVVSGTQGTLYIQQNGHGFYEHDGSNLTTDTQDVFDYRFSDGMLTSTVGDLVVNITAANQAPELTLSPLSVLASVSASSAGDIVARFTATDPDGDALSIGWTNDVTPADAQGAPLYAIDVAARTITLTEAGAAHVNAGGHLPEISLTLVDDAIDTGSATATATPHAAHGNVWFVDQTNGSDTNAGNSLDHAFASFDAANAVVAAGDTVFLVGTYQRDDYDPNFTIETAADIMDPYVWNSKGTVRIRDIHGTEDAPITYRGWDDDAKLIGQGNAGFQIDDSSHLRVENLEVVGLVDELLGVAEKLQFVYRIDNTDAGYDPSVYRYVTDGDGVTHDLLIGSDAEHDYFYRIPPDSTAAYVEEHFSQPGRLPFLPLSDERPALPNSAGILARDSVYIDIVDNHVHHVPGTGIRVQRGEYVNVIGNEVHDTTRSSSLGTQAIVVQDAQHNIDVLPDESNLYKIVFADNEVYNNFNGMYSWVGVKDFITPHLDEGNGVSPQWQTDANWIADGATGRILIADNVTYLNGMAGINNHGGDRVVVVNNTSWMNASYGHLLNVSDSGSNGGIVSPADVKGGVEYGDQIWFYNNLSVINGLHNGGNHYAIRVNPNSERVNDAGGRISGPFTYEGAANAGFDLADRQVKFGEEESAYAGFIYDTTGISARSLFVDPTQFDFRTSTGSALVQAASADIADLRLPDFITNNIYDQGAGLDQIGASGVAHLPNTLLRLDPTEPQVTLTNRIPQLPEDADTSERIKVADITISEPSLGDDDLSLTGADAAMFEIEGGALYLRAGVRLDFETLSRIAVTVSAGSDANTSFELTVGDVNELPSVTLANAVLTVPEDHDTSTRLKLADIVVQDDALGDNRLSLGGDDADLFEIANGALFLRAGTVLDFETQTRLSVAILVDDATVGFMPDGQALYDLTVVDVADDDGTPDNPDDTGVSATGSATADTISGGVGDDVLTSGAGDDEIKAGAGNDTVRAGTGDDQVAGGGGNDIIHAGKGNDTVDGGTGNDQINGGIGDDAIDGGAGGDAIGGGQGKDLIAGGKGKDNISGHRGDDVINGGRGGDKIAGGRGDDEIFGGAGDDLLRGRAGDDTLDGGAGKDRLFGNKGNDYLVGGEGNDVIRGGAGKDTIVGGHGDDRLTGGVGEDVFRFDDLRQGDEDIVTDFMIGTDNIAIRAETTDLVDAVTISDTAKGTILTISGHNILLKGVTAEKLAFDDILFV